MEKTILIAGRDYSLCKEFIQFVTDRGDKPMVTRSAADEQFSTGSFAWNRSSPVSARSLVLEAETLFSPIDTAFIIFDMATYSHSFADFSIDGIAKGLDFMMAGYMYLCIELVARFTKHKKGNICFILKNHPVLSELSKNQKKIDVFSANPLVDSAYAAFRSFAESFATQYASSPIGVQLVECAGNIQESTELYPWLFDYLDAAYEKPIVDARIAAKWVSPGAKCSTNWQLFRR